MRRQRSLWLKKQEEKAITGLEDMTKEDAILTIESIIDQMLIHKESPIELIKRIKEFDPKVAEMTLGTYVKSLCLALDYLER